MGFSGFQNGLYQKEKALIFQGFRNKYDILIHYWSPALLPVRPRLQVLGRNCQICKSGQ